MKTLHNQTTTTSIINNICGNMTKKLLFILLLAPLFTFAISSNTLKFETEDQNIKFKLQDFSVSQIDVSKGEAYSNQIAVNSEENSITFEADREDTPEIATIAQNLMQGWDLAWDKRNMKSYEAPVSTPEKMNFLLVGTLSFKYDDNNYTCDNFMIGQAHDNGNNWWGFTNTSNPIPSSDIPPSNSGETLASYQISCDQNGIPGNDITFWLSPTNNNTLSISINPIFAVPVSGPTAM